MMFRAKNLSGNEVKGYWFKLKTGKHYMVLSDAEIGTILLNGFVEIDKKTLVEIRLKCGDCNDYYVCKADRRTKYDKYLPKNKKACVDFVTKPKIIGPACEKGDK